MEILQCLQISKSFNGTHALINVSLTFPTAGIVSLIGPNGAGKSTLLNVITGFLPADSGQCFWGKHSLIGLPPYKIASLGLARTFQDLRLIVQVSAIENVLLAFPHQHGENPWNVLFRPSALREERRNREQAEQILSSVGLGREANSLAGSLSYGQQKLLTFACCIATGARIFLFDEPVAGVHSEMSARILSLLSEFRQLGKLVIFIEHDIAAVRDLADLVVVMDGGAVIATGKANEVLNRPDILEAYVG